MLKKKNKLCCITNYVVVLTMQNTHPYFEWNRLLDTPANFSPETKTRQENVDF